MVALPAFVVTMLRRYRREQSGRRLLLGEAWQDTDLIVERGDGSAVHPDVFSHQFARLAESVGLERVRLHDLRHGYASLLLASSVHPKIVSEALGHSSTAAVPLSHWIPTLTFSKASAARPRRPCSPPLGTRRRVSKALAGAVGRPTGVAFPQVND